MSCKIRNIVLIAIKIYRMEGEDKSVLPCKF